MTALLTETVVNPLCRAGRRLMAMAARTARSNIPAYPFINGIYAYQNQNEWECKHLQHRREPVLLDDIDDVKQAGHENEKSQNSEERFHGCISLSGKFHASWKYRARFF
ncbi:MAG: hypothetical protein M0003_03815 [Acidithiobacillus sp.]|nr:hypothetical protein [Acidithiobacillus sp.]